jgi:hypothetical protein
MLVNRIFVTQLLPVVNGLIAGLFSNHCNSKSKAADEITMNRLCQIFTIVIYLFIVLGNNSEECSCVHHLTVQKIYLIRWRCNVKMFILIIVFNITIMFPIRIDFALH